MLRQKIIEAKQDKVHFLNVQKASKEVRKSTVNLDPNCFKSVLSHYITKVK